MQTPGRKRGPETLLLVVILLATVAVFANGLFGAFVIDDLPQIVDSPKIKALQNIPVYFTEGVWAGTPVAPADHALYRPFFLLALAVGFQLWGLNALGYHLLCLLLHLTNVVLLFLLARRLRPAATSTALLAGVAFFALHPVHVEAVSWISSLCHLLVTAFILGAFWCHVADAESPSWKLKTAGHLLFIGALMSQEIAVAYPFLVLSHEVSKRRADALRRLAPLFAVLAAYLAIRNAVLGASVKLHLDSADAWGNLFAFAASYVKNTLVPWPQYVYLQTPGPGFIHPLSVVLALGAIALAAWGWTRARGDGPVYTFALAWFVIALLPPLSGALRSESIFALRSLYLPSAGAALLASILIDRTAPRFRRGVTGLVVIWCVAAGVSIVIANGYWADNGIVYRRMVEASPDFAGASAGLAMHFERAGQPDEALRIYLELAERSEGAGKALYYDKAGVILAKRGDLSESERLFRRALELDPEGPSAWIGLGNIALARGDTATALRHYQKAYALDDSNYQACHNLAVVHRRLGNLKEFSRQAHVCEELARERFFEP